MSSDISKEELAAKVQDAIAAGLGIPRDQVQPGKAFMTDLNADSLDIVELVLKMEKEFGIDIPDAAAKKLRTVQDAIDFVAAHIGEPRAEPGAAPAP